MLFLLVPGLARAAPGGDTGSVVDLVVMVRDARSGEAYVLGLSSRGLIGRHVEVDPADRGVRVSLPTDLPDAAPAPAVVNGRDVHVMGRAGKVSSSPNLAAPTAAVAPSATPPPVMGQVDQLWVVTPRHQAVAVLRPDDQIAWTDPDCGSCLVRVHDGVVVMARGISTAKVDAITDSVRVAKGPVDERLLALARTARAHWPSRTRIRSAAFEHVPAAGSAMPVERLAMDHDPTGRANEHLPRLHAWHLGDVAAPSLLVRAQQALAQQDLRGAKLLLAQARTAIGAAIDTDARIALWRARRGLVLALENPKDDRALREIDAAVSLAPRAVDVRLMAAEIHRVRGELERARSHLAVGLRLRPEDRAVLRALESLSSRTASQ